MKIELETRDLYKAIFLFFLTYAISYGQSNRILNEKEFLNFVTYSIDERYPNSETGIAVCIEDDIKELIEKEDI